MNNIIKTKSIIPFIILFTLLILLAYELFYAKPHEIPSALLGEPVPAFKLPTLNSSQTFFTPEQLKGHVSLLNVWATWCYACNAEHEMLMKINHEYHVPIYSIDYKDNQQEASQWLKERGNPFAIIGDDSKGDVAIDLGVYGTPETFVIDPNGKIIYRHIGAIDQKAWDEVLYPLIKKYQSS